MNSPTLSLRREINFPMDDTFLRIKELDMKDSQALIAEYKEWLEVDKVEGKHPQVLYITC